MTVNSCDPNVVYCQAVGIAGEKQGALATIIRMLAKVFAALTGRDNDTKQFSAVIAAGTSGQELIATATSKKIRIRSLFLLAAGTATDVTLISHKGMSDVTILVIPLEAHEGVVLPWNPDGWGLTAKDASLTLTTGAGSDVAVAVSGQYVDA